MRFRLISPSGKTPEPASVNGKSDVGGRSCLAHRISGLVCSVPDYSDRTSSIGVVGVGLGPTRRRTPCPTEFVSYVIKFRYLDYTQLVGDLLAKLSGFRNRNEGLLFAGLSGLLLLLEDDAF